MTSLKSRPAFENQLTLYNDEMEKRGKGGGRKILSVVMIYYAKETMAADPEMRFVIKNRDMEKSISMYICI